MRLYRTTSTDVLCLIAGTILLLPAHVQAAPTPAEQPNAEQPADPVAQAIQQVNDQDNGVTINAEAKHLDITAAVCLRQGEFLEMFACTRDSREHESILTIDAMPSTIHLGLLLLGLEPGNPLSYDTAFDPPKLVPATGPKVQVFIVIKADNIEREIPANRWVQDSQTKKMMESHTWLFAGSQFADYQGEEIYHADINGSAISLVNFGDDLLTLPNQLTDANNSHDKVWQPRTRAIPKVGTKVLIRLKPAAPKQSKAEGKVDDAKATPKEKPTQP